MEFLSPSLWSQEPWGEPLEPLKIWAEEFESHTEAGTGERGPVHCPPVVALLDNLSSTTYMHTFSYFATYLISLHPNIGQDRQFYDALLQMRKWGSENRGTCPKSPRKGSSVMPGPSHHGGPEPHSHRHRGSWGSSPSSAAAGPPSRWCHRIPSICETVWSSR